MAHWRGTQEDSDTVGTASPPTSAEREERFQKSSEELQKVPTILEQKEEKMVDN